MQNQGIPADLAIPPRPQVVEALIEERKRDEPNFHRVEQLISRDVGLAAAVLKTANSPVFGGGRRLTGIQTAMQMIGMSNVINICCGLALRHLLKAGNPVSMERFWDTAESVALRCATLARKFRTIAVDEGYSYGLFHDAGIPVLMQKYANYKDVLKEANARTGKLFVDVEGDLLGTNHAVIGSFLAVNWGLSREMIDAIRYHHDLDYFTDPSADPSGKVKNLIALGHLAEHLHHMSRRTSEDVEWEAFGEAVLAHFDISETDYQDLLNELDEE